MPAPFSERLLAWFDRHGRHDLPWQHPRTPYRVWVAEIMLQQTTVQAVVPYFQQFIDRFPDIATLAAARLDEVLASWAGLGYYARARNLHRAAALVVARHDGRFPEAFDAVLDLPGIGRSTAAAILAQACGQRHPILDGNAKRVLARHGGIGGWPGEAAVAARLWALAGQLTPGDRVADYTQAIMDLGATLCRRSKPDCGACPVAADCVARRTDRQGELPGPRPRRARPRRATRMLLCVDERGAVLLRRRPDTGVWGGLWSLPECDCGQDPRAVCAASGFAVLDAVELEPVEHSFTHFDLQIRPSLIRVSAEAVRDEDGVRWYADGDPEPPGMPAPVQRLVRAACART